MKLGGYGPTSIAILMRCLLETNLFLYDSITESVNWIYHRFLLFNYLRNNDWTLHNVYSILLTQEYNTIEGPICIPRVFADLMEVWVLLRESQNRGNHPCCTNWAPVGQSYRCARAEVLAMLAIIPHRSSLVMFSVIGLMTTTTLVRKLPDYYFI